MLMREEREQIVEYGKMASVAGLCPGTSGNMSIYNAELGYMAISPSGIDYFRTEPEDVVISDLHAHIVDGARRPSSEWALHSIFYRERPEARAVVHTHSVFCTTLGILGEPLRAVHYVIGQAGVDTVPLAPYRLFGTQELAQAAIDACGESRAVLLTNHGMLAYGRDLRDAYELAKILEYVAELQYRALCVGEPKVLTRGQMERVLERASRYGQTGKK